MKEKIKGIILCGLISISIFASFLITDLFKVYKGDKNIWWNPRSMMLSLEETRDNFEIFIGGKLFRNHIKEEQLYVHLDKDEKYMVVPKDVGVRINHWYKQKASMLEGLLWNAFGTGFGLACLIVGLALRRQSDNR